MGQAERIGGVGRIGRVDAGGLLRARSAVAALRLLGGDEPAGRIGEGALAGLRLRTRGRGGMRRVVVGLGERGPIARLEPGVDGAERVIADRRRNGEIYLCAWPRPEREGEKSAREHTVATRDPHDRAHEQRGEAGLLAQAEDLGGVARPRRYPACQVNNAGYALDSQFDDLYERQRRLDRELGGVAGVSLNGGAGKSSSSVALERLQVVCGNDFDRARGLLRRRTYEVDR